MRIIYRSASKRQLNAHSPSLTRDLLERVRSYFLSLFSRLGSLRSSFCRFLFCGLTWVAVAAFVLPWVGPLFVTCWLCRRWAVPWLFKLVSAQGDLPETSVGVRDPGAGFYHILLKYEGQVCQKTILEQINRFVSLRSKEADGWKIKSSLVRLRFGFWAWRKSIPYDVTNHVSFCDEIWQGSPLNSQNLKYKVNELCGVPLESNLPPWHVHVVPYVVKENRAPCYALLIRAHHLIANFFRIEDFCLYNTEERGLRNALAHALSQIEDSTSFDEELQIVDQNGKFNVLHQAIDQVLNIVDFIWKAPALLLCDMMLCAQHLVRSWKPGGYRNKRALGWSDPISEDLVNRLKSASGAESVEAVLLSCFAGALHHYKAISGSPDLRDDMVRALIPRGNGFVRVTLPIGQSCPKARLRFIQRSLSRGTSDTRYSLSCILTSVWSKFVPSLVGSHVAKMFSKRYPVLLDTVNIQASDYSIMETNYWKLAPVDFGLSLTFVHYGDHVTLSAMSNFETLQRPDLLASSFDRAVVDLALAFNVRYERKPSPPSTPTKTFSGRGF